MARNWKIGSINDTPVTITLPWIGVFVVVTLNFGSMDIIYTMSHLLPISKQLIVPSQPLTNLTFGLIAAIGIYISIVLHEIGHAEIAKRNDIDINKIELFLFGGKAEMAEEPSEPLSAFKIAVAGPMVSLLIAFGLLLVNILFYKSITPVVFALTMSMMLANIMMTVFNMVPAYPLDGGRVVKALLEHQYSQDIAHKRTMDATKTTGFCIAVMAIQFAEPVGLLFAGFLYVTAERTSQTNKMSLTL